MEPRALLLELIRLPKHRGHAFMPVHPVARFVQLTHYLDGDANDPDQVNLLPESLYAKLYLHKPGQYPLVVQSCCTELCFS